MMKQTKPQKFITTFMNAFVFSALSISSNTQASNFSNATIDFYGYHCDINGVQCGDGRSGYVHELVYPGNEFSISGSGYAYLEASNNNIGYGIDGLHTEFFSVDMFLSTSQLFSLTGTHESAVNPDPVTIIDYDAIDISKDYYGSADTQISVYSITEDRLIYESFTLANESNFNTIDAIYFNQILDAGSYRITASANASFGNANSTFSMTGHYSPLPIPATIWLFGSGLLGLFGIARSNRKLAY